MVTPIKLHSVEGQTIFEFVGKSTDIKPKASNGSKFTEMDTGDEFFYDGDEQGWTKRADKYLVEIEVTTAPTKVSYVEGDTFDATGMVVTAHYTDNSSAVVSTYEVEVENPLTVSTDHVTIKYVENGRTREVTQEIEVEALAVSSIAITAQPTYTEYFVGAELDLTGIEVTATYNNGDTEDVTDECEFSPADGTVLDEAGSVTVTASFEGKTATTTVTVTAVELKSIAWTGTPKVAYTAGEELDLTGAEITATYTDDSTEVVTDQCTFSPAEGTVLTTEDNRVTASFTDGEVTKTSYKVLTVTQE